MTYKIGANTIINTDRQGVFNTVYFNNDTYDMADTTGFKEISNTWFSQTGNVSVSRLSANTFAQYTQAMGFNYGYTSGGRFPGDTNADTIDKFPFASAAVNSTDVGNLTISRGLTAGQSSSTHGYNSGGYDIEFDTMYNRIDKFPFASDTNASTVGNLFTTRFGGGGQSSTTHGYTSGGNTPTNVEQSVIDKFPFASDTNASSVGNLTVSREVACGQSSMTHGYSSGGQTNNLPFTTSSTIDRFPFASDASASSVGSLSLSRHEAAGQSSAEHGYTSGGITAPAIVNRIDRYPFAVSPASATTVGNLTFARYGPGGASSVSHGYSSGGLSPTTVPTITNITDRFPFASLSTNATDVGDLTANRDSTAGQQY